MKILLIHNNYGIYTGEEAVIDKQVSLFKEMGHFVVVYRKTTEGVRGTLIRDIKGFFQGFYSPASIKDIKNIIKINKPDVVIVHNLYPYISPAILNPLRQAGIPIVMTVHNFRLICPTGLFMRNSQPCELCLEKRNEWSCMRYNCENSYVRSIGYAGRNWYARVTKVYKENVDYFACITKFQIQKLVEADFDPAKMIHIPNFTESIAQPEFETGDYVAVSGRLSKEKGIDLILKVAFKTPYIKYLFAGQPREEDPINIPIPDNCIFLGNLSKDKMQEFYKHSRFLLNSSRCYEGFPITILEAAAYGKPTIGPAHAGFLEIIRDNETGLLFTPGDINDLQNKIEKLWNNEEMNHKFGEMAYKTLTENYSIHSVKVMWQSLFDKIYKNGSLHSKTEI
ncbi:MAG: glycosyltransferase family 4 protein [Bacteroidales bacterium]|nr:glycosyltransferase family 4 protein [Bacteroidales bacterium]